MDELLKILNSMPREEQEAFASACSTTIGYLRKAVHAKEKYRPALCVAIERETGGKVTRQQLRPKDWRDIWPELGMNNGLTLT